MADAITIKALQDASLDAKSLEEVVNGNESKQVTTRKGETYPSVKKAIKTLFENGGLPATPFTTKALMEASTLVDGDYAMVTEDTDKNGLYIKTEGAWVESGYDPIAVAKNETLAKVAAFIYTDDNNTDDIVKEVDANGTTVRRIDKTGKHWFVGIDKDLGSALKDLDVSDAIELSDTDDTDIFTIKDVAGRTASKQTADGHLHAVGVGDITQKLLDLEQGGSDTGALNLDNLHLAGKYSDYAVAESVTPYSKVERLLSAVDVNALNIFPHNVQRLRIPAITRIGKTKYLLTFEARTELSDVSETSVGSAIVDIDPDTLAVSVSDIKSIHNAFTDESGKLYTFINITSVKLANGKIIMMYIRRHETLEHNLYMRTSTDDGATWSSFEDLNYLGDADNINLICPCSQGHEKRFGQHKGRIVFPAWKAGQRGIAYKPASYRAGYIYSDDGGTTWQMGEFTEFVGGNEVQCAEDLNGDMLFCVRLLHTQPEDERRLIVRHSDKTKVYKTLDVNKVLSKEAVMSGLIQGDNRYDFSAAKFHLSTCLEPTRKTMLIHTSYDGGTTWRTFTIPEVLNIGAAYSCIENISASHKFVLWESGSMTNFDCAVLSLDKLIEEQ